MIKLKITSLILAVSIVFGMLTLTGCHGGKSLPAFEIPESLDTSETYNITFWAKNDNNSMQQEIYKQAIIDFEALYPNINVNLKLYNDYGLIYQDVITNISTNTTPNICITYPDHIATYMSGVNVVVPLDGLINDEKFGLGSSELKFDAPTKDEIVPEFLGECILADSCYALPFMRSTEACYINKDMVEALGYEVPDILTWDFIWEVSEAAIALGKETVTNEKGEQTEVYALNGQSVLIPFIYKSTDNMMIQMLEQLDAGYSTDNGDILIFNEETEGILYEVAKHAKTRSFSTFKISSYPGNFLNAGQCIFAVDSTAGATWIGSNAPLMDIPEDELVQFETVVRPIPQYDKENPEMISQGPSVCIFNKENPCEVLASWLFLQFLLTNDVQINYAMTEGYVPVTTKAQSSEKYQDYLSRSGEDNDTYYSIKLDATKLLLNNIENTFVTPVFNGSASLRNAAGQLIEEVAKSVRRNQTVDGEYMQKLYKKVTSLYKLNSFSAASAGEDKQEFEAMPVASVVLIASLFTVWFAMIVYLIVKKLKNLKKQN